jgi:hypothetical protein
MEANQHQTPDTERIADSLLGMQKAGPGHFFYTRVQARLQRREASIWGRWALFIARPGVALTTLCIIFLVNAGVLLYQRGSVTVSAGTDQAEQANPDDYNTTLASNSYYEENTDPR